MSAGGAKRNNWSPAGNSALQPGRPKATRFHYGISHIACAILLCALAIPSSYLLVSENSSQGPTSADPEDGSKPELMLPLTFKLPPRITIGPVKQDISQSGRFAAMQAVDTARSDYRDYFGDRHLKPGQFIWRSGPSDRSALHIVVSIAHQRAYVYEGPILLAATTVSTGRSSHPTPTGIFPILEKHEFKLSNLYDDAPMPFMQRLTWDGIAFHAGHVPGVPASHGCIRLPMAFAEKLFSLTRNGAPVLIAH